MWFVALNTGLCCVTATCLFTTPRRISQGFTAAAKRCADAFGVLIFLFDPSPRVFSWFVRCALCFCVISTVVLVLWFSGLNPLCSDPYKSLTGYKTNLYKSRGVPGLCSVHFASPSLHYFNPLHCRFGFFFLPQKKSFPSQSHFRTR